MEWELKRYMCQLFDEGKQREATKVFHSHIKGLDDQTLDMFITAVFIEPNSINESLELHCDIVKHIKLSSRVNFKVSPVTATRINHYTLMVERVAERINEPLKIEYLFANGFRLSSRESNQYLFLNYNGFQIIIHIDEKTNDFWYHMAGDKKFIVSSIGRLCFLIEFITGDKWKL